VWLNILFIRHPLLSVKGVFLQKVDILIHGCIVLPLNGRDFIRDGALAIRDGRIVFVGKSSAAMNTRADLRMNAKGKVAMPGLINCHTHVPMTLFRGIAEDQPLQKWLKETIWPLEAKLSPTDVYGGALLGCTEMIQSGTTCFSDMYFHEHMVAKAVETSGLRAVLAEGIIEAGNKELGRKMLEKSVDFAESFSGHANGRVSTMLAPHAAYSCSPQILALVSERASSLGVGVHLHVAESKALFKQSRKKYDASETEFLDSIGFLKDNVVAAHCIDLSGRDMKILSKRRVNVAYVPVGNMKLGLGAARIKDLIDLGVNVGLGTDGPASNNSLDMFETMKFAALLQKLAYRDPEILPAYDVLKMTTINGAKALGLEKDVGSLEVGKKADVILLDLSKPHLNPLHDIYANLVYSTRGSDVDTVIVDGKILMENKHVATLDEHTVIEKADKTALDLLR
jgi:5-methylthioadenosine/S-adenosylhomocysteine deaminase